MKTSKGFSLFALCFLWTISSLGQYNTTIRSGRPGQSIGPYGVGKNIIQVQTGFEFLNRSGVFSNKNYESVMVIRYGLSEKFELNTGWKYNFRTNLNALPQQQNGITLGAIGCRINVLDGKDYVPSVGFQFSAKLPRLSSDFLVNRLALRSTLIVRQKLSNKLSLMTNFSLDYSGNSIDPIGVYVVNLAWATTKKWHLQCEVFGSYTNSTLTNFFDVGTSYLVTNNFQLDFTAGVGNSNAVVTYFMNAGISWRFTKFYDNEKL